MAAHRVFGREHIGELVGAEVLRTGGVIGVLHLVGIEVVVGIGEIAAAEARFVARISKARLQATAIAAASLVLAVTSIVLSVAL